MRGCARCWAAAMTIDTDRAHRHSANHRAQLLASERCGCFFCLAMFSPQAVVEWIDAPADAAADANDDEVGVTALCPACGIDAVIGSASGFAIERAFLQAMQARWFAGMA